MEFFTEQILSSLPDGLVFIQSDQTINYLNPTAEKMVGFSLSQTIGKTVSEIFSAIEQLPQFLKTTLETGRSFTIREDEFRNRFRESLIVEINLSPIYNADGKPDGAILLLRDLSSLKKMEEEFRYNDRLAVMGNIASGLAHEIKNPLGGIKGAAQMILRELKQNDLKEYLEIIVKEANRVNELILQLLTFSRPKKIKYSSVNLNKLLDEVIQLEEQVSRTSKIKWIRAFDPSIPKIRGDENQLKQAFLNFIKNAEEAITKNGKIEIVTRFVTDYQLKTEKGGRARLVVVEIIDSGSGMDDKTLANLFAPFYTTKKGGTGLGLAISHRIISEHQGMVHVESIPKKGTTFRVFLRALNI